MRLLFPSPANFRACARTLLATRREAHAHFLARHPPLRACVWKPRCVCHRPSLTSTGALGLPIGRPGGVSQHASRLGVFLPRLRAFSAISCELLQVSGRGGPLPSAACSARGPRAVWGRCCFPPSSSALAVLRRRAGQGPGGGGAAASHVGGGAVSTWVGGQGACPELGASVGRIKGSSDPALDTSRDVPRGTMKCPCAAPPPPIAPALEIPPLGETPKPCPQDSLITWGAPTPLCPPTDPVLDMQPWRPTTSWAPWPWGASLGAHPPPPACARSPP